MRNFFTKPYRWAGVYSLFLIAFFGYALLDTFVIPKEFVVVAEEATTDSTVNDGTTASAPTIGTTSQEAASTPVLTENTYQDENIKLSIETLRQYDSAIYIADIQVSDISYLKTALAGDTYGRNIKDTTSDIAEDHQAIFAINGDFYGFRDAGYVLRNGVLYRDTAREEGEDEALVIDQEGSFSIIKENEVSIDALTNSWQILSFGPALIQDGTITVDSHSEVSKAMSSNPRTAIGQISPLHYIIIVSDGRTDESAGLSLLELAKVFEDKGCTVAYNLDGGGSSTLYFNGEVVNNPTDGRSNKEREVSDIVYIGY